MTFERNARMAASVFAVALTLAAAVASPTWASVLANPSPQQLEEVARLIEKHYVLRIPRDSLDGAARRCFAGTLDRYSVYLDSAAAGEFNTNLAGRFGGIGAGLAFDSASAAVHIVSLYEDSPALRAGLHVGDTLAAIDGDAVRGRSLPDVLGRIRGRVGTRVRVAVRRPGAAEPLQFAMQRMAVQFPTVRGLRLGESDEARYLVDDRTRTAYIRIENFSRRTLDEFDRALAAVERLHPRGLVLDLRENPGGAVRAAIGIADRFLDSGTIMIWKIPGRKDQVARADAKVATHLPLAVLVNERTASAAEVLAASLQDHRRAIVVGTRSFGKGMVLDLFPLRRAPGLAKLTVAIWERPSGQTLERHFAGIGSERGGVWPDSGLAIAVPPDEADRWADDAWRILSHVGVVGAAKDTTSSPPDRVLARAVEALGRAH